MTPDLLPTTVDRFLAGPEPERDFIGTATCLLVAVERHGVMPGWMVTVVRGGHDGASCPESYLRHRTR